MATNTNRKSKTTKHARRLAAQRCRRQNSTEPGKWIIGPVDIDAPGPVTLHVVHGPGPVIPATPVSGPTAETMSEQFIAMAFGHLTDAMARGAITVELDGLNQVLHHCSDEGGRFVTTEIWSADGPIGTLAFVPAAQGH